MGFNVSEDLNTETGEISLNREIMRLGYSAARTFEIRLSHHHENAIEVVQYELWCLFPVSRSAGS